MKRRRPFFVIILLAISCCFLAAPTPGHRTRRPGGSSQVRSYNRRNKRRGKTSLPVAVGIVVVLVGAGYFASRYKRKSV